jgi:hypothetical protein
MSVINSSSKEGQVDVNDMAYMKAIRGIIWLKYKPGVLEE